MSHEYPEPVRHTLETMLTPENKARGDIFKEVAARLTDGYVDRFTERYQPAFSRLLEQNQNYITDWIDHPERQPKILASVIEALTSDDTIHGQQEAA